MGIELSRKYLLTIQQNMHSCKTSAYSSVPKDKFTLKEFIFLKKVLFSPAGYYHCGL